MRAKEICLLRAAWVVPNGLKNMHFEFQMHPLRMTDGKEHTAALIACRYLISVDPAVNFNEAVLRQYDRFEPF